jgi:signal transduction protein with GAF and PtsI domain
MVEIKRQHISILEEIFRIITDSKKPEHTLELIVKQIADKLNTDVCSVYVFDPNFHERSGRSDRSGDRKDGTGVRG